MTVTSPASVTYTQGLAKGGALLSETRVLLGAWRSGETEADLANRALQEDLLGRATARRVLDIARVFALRYLTPDDSAARHLQRLVAGDVPAQCYSDLVFHYTARRDALLHDFTIWRHWPAVREGRLIVTNRDVQQLILEAETDGRIPAPWSAEIKRDMAGRVLIALTDFGLLRQLKPAKREVLPYRPADATVVYLAYLLHDQGVTDSSLAQHPDWALFGLEPPDVWRRLEALAADGWFVVQRAGQVARITWQYVKIEDVVDGLAR